MRAVYFYQTVDNQAFDSYSKAVQHCENQIGKIIDELLKQSVPDPKLKLQLLDKIVKSPALIKELNAWVECLANDPRKGMN